MKQERSSFDEPRADETAPGLRLIRQVWDIKPVKTQRDVAPSNVTHDIYQVPSRNSDVPRRHSGQPR